MAGTWDADLIVLPEAAIPMMRSTAGEYLADVERRAMASDTGVILGIVQRAPGEIWAFHNSALGLGRAEGDYAKRHLVPFGEYVPLESLLRGVIGFFNLPMSGTHPGAASQPPVRLHRDDRSIELALVICYEIAYPELVASAASDPALMVTISNDAWFGSSLGPWQHLQIARMRALEMGRALLRATNNGVTAVVSADGSLAASIPRGAREVLYASVELRRGQTPWQRWGHAWLIWLAVAAMYALLLYQGWLTRR